MTQAPPVLSAGKGEFIPPDPDAFRAYVRDHKAYSLLKG
jgi:hypothetical protein